MVGRWAIGPWLDRIAGPMNSLALEMLDPRGGERVLEIGFGGGALLRALAARGAAAAGIDVSEAMVRRARGLDARLGSVDALPFEDESFDKAVSVNSLYFWPDPGAALLEIARVLRPGGGLVLCFEPAGELRKWPGFRHGFRLFEVEAVRGLMAAAGFGSIEERWGTGRKPDRFCALSGRLGNANR